MIRNDAGPLNRETYRNKDVAIQTDPGLQLADDSIGTPSVGMPKTQNIVAGIVYAVDPTPVGIGKGIAEVMIEKVDPWVKKMQRRRSRSVDYWLSE